MDATQIPAPSPVVDPEPADEPTVLYRFYDAEDRLLYVGISMDLPIRWKMHANGSKPWWRAAVRATLEHFGSREEAAAAEVTAIENEHPLWNLRHHRERRRQIRTSPHGKIGNGSLLRTADVATEMSCSKSTVINWCDAGLLRVEYTAGGHRRIIAASLTDLRTALAFAPGPDRERAMRDLQRRNRREVE